MAGCRAGELDVARAGRRGSSSEPPSVRREGSTGAIPRGPTRRARKPPTVTTSVKRRVEATCRMAHEDDRQYQVRPLDERVNILDVALQASATTRANVAATDAGTIERAEPDMSKVMTDAGPGLRRDAQPPSASTTGLAAARDPEANVRSDHDRRCQAVGCALRGSTRRAPGRATRHTPAQRAFIVEGRGRSLYCLRRRPCRGDGA